MARYGRCFFFVFLSKCLRLIKNYKKSEFSINCTFWICQLTAFLLCLFVVHKRRRRNQKVIPARFGALIKHLFFVMTPQL